jgi:hypothetical protein
LGELFDASALGLVTLMLLFASFYATWRGMQDFVASRAAAGGVTTTGLVVLVVLTLTLAMYVALREMVNPVRRRNIFIAFPLYALLALWSVGFGYGFWWSLVAGQNATEQALSRSVESLGEATSELRAELAAGAALMQTAERLSEEKAQAEITRGGTCGVASGAGDGPLSRARAETRSQIAAFAAGVQEDWLGPVDLRLTQLETLAAADEVASETPEERKRRMVALGQRVRRTAQDVSADATARGKILATQLRAKAERLSVAPVSGTVDYCYDPDLATSLMLVADAVEGPFEIEVTRFRFAEGADGVAQAVEDLWLGAFARLGLVEREAAAGAQLDGRSLIALIAAIGVDFALFVFALLRGGMRRGYEGEPDSPSTESGNARTEAQAALPDNPKQAALPAPEDEQPRETDVSAQTNELFGEGEVRDAEIVGDTKPPLRPESFVPENQMDPADQLDALLNKAKQHMAAMQTAGSKVDESRARNHLNDVLRQLRKIGYRDAGMSDHMYKDGLHQIMGEEPSDLPRGSILRIIRPRFVSPDGDVLIAALVIVSAGPHKDST